MKCRQYIRRMSTLLSRWKWPAVCEVCAAWPAEPVCKLCLHELGQPRRRCPGCALPLAPGLALCIRCVESPQRMLARCSARVDYIYPWPGIIARFKFQGHLAWAGTLASLMLEADEAQEWLRETDLLAPIPLSASRLRERGFNQAWEMVRHIKRHAPVGVQALPDLLLRAETDRLQHTLTRDDRFTHARAALHINPTRAANLHHARVLLVDDVMTTGATLEAAAHTLLAAGAGSVKALVFARTPALLDGGPGQDDDVE